MVNESIVTDGFHLVGSLPSGSFSSASDVFVKIQKALFGRLKRIPDGELGERFYYVLWQRERFHPQTLKHVVMDPNNSNSTPHSTKELAVSPTRYDEAAIPSYREYCLCQEAGIIPNDVRFQVSLPSPVEPPSLFVRESYLKDIAPVYEKQMVQALKKMQSEICAEDLAIQWDLAATIALIEQQRGRYKNSPFAWFEDPIDYTISLFRRIAVLVGPKVEMGFHLCYGDMEHKHFIEPEDLSILVELANRFVEEIHPLHPISWFHMPVPKDRVDDMFFEPLKRLTLPPSTQLFLGLLHPNDLDGAKKRIEMARNAFPRGFGISTECGMGRTPEDEGKSIFEIASSLTRPCMHNDV
jgi:hypothetical protein